jgi:internalin A
MITRVSLLSLLFAVPALVLACDEPKKDAAADAGAKPVATAAPSAVASSASAAPEPVKKKKVECATGPNVEFADPAVETEVRRKLGKDGGAITKDDLKGVRSLNLTIKPVNELDPCVFPLFVNLKDLFLGPGELEDLTPLATLYNLETVRASVSKVRDIKPLEKLVKMDRLDLGRTQVSDISVLANLGNLTELALDDTDVSDIGPLRGLIKLEKVSIKRTRVKDLSPLKDHKKLKFVWIEGAPIEDTNALTLLVNNGMRLVRSGK